MKKIKITDHGFYGCYWPVSNSKSAIIAMLGDDCEDYMAKCAVKWVQNKFGISVMTLSPAHKNYGHHNMPIERIGAAIEYMKKRGISKFAITGASTTGMLSLLAASYYPEITLTIAMTPCDFVMEGFYCGKRDGYREWPGDGESTVTWEGKPLPYLPYAYRHPDYGRMLEKEAKEGGDLLASRKMFDESERLHPLREEEMIKVENIKGRLLLIGADDDVLWDTAKYIHRIKERLDSKPHDCKVKACIYKHGTHFVFPEGMVRYILPVGTDLISAVFRAGRDYPKECRRTRTDIDRRITAAIKAWKA